MSKKLSSFPEQKASDLGDAVLVPLIMPGAGSFTNATVTLSELSAYLASVAQGRPKEPEQPAEPQEPTHPTPPVQPGDPAAVAFAGWPAVPARSAGPRWDSVATRPTLSMDAVTEVPPGARVIHVRLVASRTVFSTATIRRPRVANISGGGVNVGDAAAQARWYPSTLPFWRPGRDQSLENYLILTVPSDVSLAVGNRISVSVNLQGCGWENGGTLSGEVRVTAGAVNSLPSLMHRPPLQLDVSHANAAANLDVAAMEWSDSGYVGNAPRGDWTARPRAAGSKPCWSSRLAGGQPYTQTSNGELGAYLNTDAFPSHAVTPHSKGVDAAGRPFFRLHTRKLASPVTIAGTSYHFQAAAICGQTMDEWCARTGIFRAQLVTPSRIGAWSAYWCVGRNIANAGNRWPPEIDFFEHFNQAFGADSWDFMDGRLTTSSQHAGVFGENQRRRHVGFTTNLRSLGWVGDVDLYKQIHDYACLVTEDWVVHFVDGIETYAHPNMALHQDPAQDHTYDLFPILNVAVKPANTDSAYSDGSGDLLLYGMQRYGLGSGYTLTEWRQAAPWPNRKVLPDPQA